MKKFYKPLIIAHRGYCSIFPENTIQSFQAAFGRCNYIEFDVMLSKDHQVIIFHDRYLARLTKKDTLQQSYPQRKKIEEFEGESKEQWWVKDFSFEQLRRFQIQQTFPKRPKYQHLNFRIPSLSQAFENALKVKREQLTEDVTGFLIQLKSAHTKQDSKQDEKLVQKLTENLQKYGLTTEQDCKRQNFPIILQSFSHHILNLISKTKLKLPIVHLFQKETNLTAQFLKNKLFQRSIGVGIPHQLATAESIKLFHQMNLQVFFWTVRDDCPEKLPFKLSNYTDVYNHLFDLRIDGIITEYPQNCKRYEQLYHLRQKKERQDK